MKKFMCRITLPRCSSADIIIEAKDIIQAKAMFKTLYGAAAMKTGVVCV